MWSDIFLASLWGGIVALDTTAVMQIMIARPMVACSIVGLLLGNFPLGFMIGIGLVVVEVNTVKHGERPPYLVFVCL